MIRLTSALLVLLSASGTYSQFLTNGCPIDFSVHLLLPHGTDCGLYYACSNGRKIQMPCPGGLHFDVKRQICNWPHEANCVPSTTTNNPIPTTVYTTRATSPGPDTFPNGCPKDFNKHALLPHAHDCAKFYICSNGHAILQQCANGLLFDTEHGVCSWPDSVTCHPGTTTTTAEELQTTTTTTKLTTTTTEVPATTTTTTEEPSAITTTEEPATTTTSTTEEPTTTTTTAEPTTTTTTTEKLTPTTTTEEPTTTTTTKQPATTTTTEQPSTTTTTTTEEHTTTRTTEEHTTTTTTADPKTTTTATDKPATTTTKTTEEPATTTTTARTEPTTSTTTEESATTTTTEEPSRTTTTEKPFITTTTEEPLRTTTTEEPLLTTTTEDPSTSPPPVVTTPASVCPPGVFGNVPHPYLCDVFYMCTGAGDPIQLPCPNTFEFDPYVGQCVPIAPGGCTLGPITTTEEVLPTTTTEDPLKTTTTEGPLPTTTTYEPSRTTTTVEPLRTTTTEEPLQTTTTEGPLPTTTTYEPLQTTTTEEPFLTTTSKEFLTTSPPPVVTTPASVCPPGVFGNVPHPYLCDVFYMCTGAGDPIQLPCPNTFEFDPYVGQCVPIAPGGCTLGSITTTTTEGPLPTTTTTKEPLRTTTIEEPLRTTTTDEPLLTTTSKEFSTTSPPPVVTTPASVCPPGVFGNVPHPYLCDVFYMCTGAGDPIQLPCPNTFEFDPYVGQCVPIAPGGCTLGPITTTEESLPITTTEQSSTITTEEYLTTTTEEPSTSTEDPLTTTTEDEAVTTNKPEEPVRTTTTEKSSIITTTEEYSTTPSEAPSTTTEKPLTTSPPPVVTTPASVCPPGVFGNVPHPYLCDVFYMCTGAGDPIQLPCPNTFEFDPNVGQCVPIAPGGCTLGPITTTEEVLPTTTTEDPLQTTTTEGPLPTTTTYEPSRTTTTEEPLRTTTTEEPLQTTTTEGPLPTTTTYEPLQTTTTEEPLRTTTTEEPLPTTTTKESLTTSPPPVVTTPASVCPPGVFGNVPHPYLCDVFYMCTGAGDPIQLPCPNTFEFDPYVGQCVPIAPGGCTLGPITTTTTEGPLPTSTTESSSTITTEEYLTTTTKAPSTTTEEPLTTTTKDEAVTTNKPEEPVRTTTTEKSSSITTTEEYSTTTSKAPSTTTEKPLTTSPPPVVTTPASVCPPGVFGNVPHPYLCDVFYMCTGAGDPIQLPCPNTFEFDPNVGQCVPIAPGGCTLGPITTTTTEGPLPTTTTKEPLRTTTEEPLQTTTTEEPSEEPTSPPPVVTTPASVCPPGVFGNVPHPYLCDVFYMCTGAGDPIQLPCPNTFEFDPYAGHCVPIATGGCTLPNGRANNKAINEHVTTTYQQKTDNAQSTDKQAKYITPDVDLCSNTAFGYIPHPILCNSYFLCTGTQAVEMQCGYGFEFDARSNKCMLISSTGCYANATTDGKLVDP